MLRHSGENANYNNTVKTGTVCMVFVLLQLRAERWGV